MRLSGDVNARVLVPLAWTLWSALLLGLVFVTVRISTERTSSPESGRGIGLFVAGLLFLGVAVMGALLWWFARKPSPVGLLIVTLVMLYPIVVLVAGPVLKAFKEHRFAQAQVAVGDFRDPALTSMATAIAANDVATLEKLLGGRPPPAGADRAGHDLLAFAIVTLTNGKCGAGPVRTLLAAGANPNAARLPNGRPLITWLIVSRYSAPEAPEAVRLLLEHKLDPNVRDPAHQGTALRDAGEQPDIVRLLVDHGADLDPLDEYGLSPLVHFVSTRAWDSALILIEKGARLDIANTNGVSLDYYLKDWKDSVFGEHPAGWDQVRSAIARRRAGATAPAR